MTTDEVVYGVVRGVDAPGGPSAAEDERRLLVFAVDTRTHGAPRLLVDLAELERLDEADRPPTPPSPPTSTRSPPGRPGRRRPRPLRRPP